MFDIESYVARYAPSSETRFQRLLFLARHAPSQTMSLTAYRLLETQLKEAANDVMYEQVFDPSTCASKSEEGEDEMGGNASMEYVMESSAVGGMIVADDNEGTFCSISHDFHSQTPYTCFMVSIWSMGSMGSKIAFESHGPLTKSRNLLLY